MENLIPELKLPGEGTFLDYAVQEMVDKEKLDIEYVEPYQATFLIVGNSSAGKTSLINRFYGKSDPVEPTLMLDYFPSTKTHITESNESAQCHIWELADGTLYEQALFYLTSSPNLTVVMCMDLSKPHFLYSTQEEVLNMTLKFIKRRSDFEEVHKARVAQMPSNHPDAGYLKPFPVPLVIIGCMYDIFSKMEPEKKKIITQFMRYVAHLYGAYLFYWTDRNNEIMKHAKEILKHYAYGSEMPTLKKTDYNIAVVVPPYYDSFAEIEPSAPDGNHNIEKFRLLLEAHFPQENISKSISQENPADNPKYADPVIDLLRKQQLQKEVLFQNLERTPEEEDTNKYKMVNPFTDIEPVEFRNTTSEN